MGDKETKKQRKGKAHEPERHHVFACRGPGRDRGRQEGLPCLREDERHIGTVSLYPAIDGSFDSEDAEFDPERNSLYVAFGG